MTQPSFVRYFLLMPMLVPIMAATVAAQAQTPAPNSPIRRTVVQKADISVPGSEAVVMRVELDRGAAAGRHTHPGDEIGYVLEGEADLAVHGEDPRRIRPGDSFIIPAGTVHDAVSVGAGPLKLHSVLIVQKGKPLATPAK